MEAVSERLLELLHHLKHEREYKKRTQIALELVQQIEHEGHFADANYAFDNGVLSLELTGYIELRGKQWVSELECSRNIQWSYERIIQSHSAIPKLTVAMVKQRSIGLLAR